MIETKYVMSEMMDYTDARVRVKGEDIWIRVGGRKINKSDHKFLIDEAEEQYDARNAA